MRSTLALLVGALAIAVAPSEGQAAHGISDSEAVALELSGELLAPPELISLVDADLTIIRSINDALDSVSVFLEWVAGEVLVHLDSVAFTELQAGTYTGFDSLNAVYGPAAAYPFGSFTWVKLVFDAKYNAALLAPIYAQAPGAVYAQPNWVSFSGRSSDIRADSLGTYTFDYAWGCDLTCLHVYSWTYQVTPDGDVIVLAHGGDPPPALSAGTLSADDRFSGYCIHPNPTNGRLRVTLEGSTAGPVALFLYDVQGRLIRRGAMNAGDLGAREWRWDGRDRNGNVAAAGSYFLTAILEDGARTTSRVVVLR